MSILRFIKQLLPAPFLSDKLQEAGIGRGMERAASAPPPSDETPEQIAARYERLLIEAENLRDAALSIHPGAQWHGLALGEIALYAMSATVLNRFCIDVSESLCRRDWPLGMRRSDGLVGLHPPHLRMLAATTERGGWAPPPREADRPDPPTPTRPPKPEAKPKAKPSTETTRRVIHLGD